MGPRLEREKQKTLNRSASRGHVEPLDAVKCYWGQRGSLGYQPLAGESPGFLAVPLRRLGESPSLREGPVLPSLEVSQGTGLAGR